MKYVVGYFFFLIIEAIVQDDVQRNALEFWVSGKKTMVGTSNRILEGKKKNVIREGVTWS